MAKTIQPPKKIGKLAPWPTSMANLRIATLASRTLHCKRSNPIPSRDTLNQRPQRMKRHGEILWSNPGIINLAIYPYTIPMYSLYNPYIFWPNGIIFHQPSLLWNSRGFPLLNHHLGAHGQALNFFNFTKRNKFCTTGIHRYVRSLISLAQYFEYSLWHFVVLRHCWNERPKNWL